VAGFFPKRNFAIRRVEQRVLFGGHNIPSETIRRRYLRGWGNLQGHYIGIVDEWVIYDAACTPPIIMKTGDNRPPEKLMEDAATYPGESGKTTPVKPLDDPDFIGMDAAIRRSSAKAIAKARAAGLEPVVSDGNSRITPGGV
jgi:hypothetical protein